ncbi:MAG: hypothetical protein RMK98_06155 [Bacteroidia bacterium]|nr:hypothetical protein [Bacteroidia bacterium]
MQKWALHLLSNVRLWRYFLVAAGGTLLDILLYALLVKGGITHWLALSISFK